MKEKQASAKQAIFFLKHYFLLFVMDTENLSLLENNPLSLPRQHTVQKVEGKVSFFPDCVSRHLTQTWLLKRRSQRSFSILVSVTSKTDVAG